MISARPSASHPPGWRRIAGFTLIELLLVLLILGIAYGLSAPLLSNGSVGLELKAAARQIAAGLRQARSLAASGHIETVLTLDVEKNNFSISGDPKTYTLPRKLIFSLFTAQSELQDEAAGSIRFFPDGSSTGGRVMIAAGNEKLSVDVNWLTGRVSIL
jgi:general secretion pathway protein H